LEHFNIESQANHGKSAYNPKGLFFFTALNNIQVANKSVKTNKLSTLLERLMAAATGVQAMINAEIRAAVCP
jgi:hypothetical protein